MYSPLNHCDFIHQTWGVWGLSQLLWFSCFLHTRYSKSRKQEAGSDGGNTGTYHSADKQATPLPQVSGVTGSPKSASCTSLYSRWAGLAADGRLINGGWTRNQVIVRFLSEASTQSMQAFFVRSVCLFPHTGGVLVIVTFNLDISATGLSQAQRHLDHSRHWTLKQFGHGHGSISQVSRGSLDSFCGFLGRVGFGAGK